MVKNASNPKRIVVIGASGFGRESLDVLEAMKEAGVNIEIVGVVDDNPSELNLVRLKDRQVEFLGTVDELISTSQQNLFYITGIGNPQIRVKIVNKVENAGLKAFTAVHPTAILGTQTKISRGVVVCAGAVISTNVRLQQFVHINPNVTIGHDSVIEEFASINPGAIISGEVSVRSHALVGAGATILQGLVIGRGALVGACACVTKDVQESITVKGIPAK